MKFSRFFITLFLISCTLCANAEEIMLAPKEIIDDYLEMADTYAFSGNYQKALDYVDMVVGFEPKNATARYKQALLLTTLKKNDEAKASFLKALALNPKYANSELAAMLGYAQTKKDEQFSSANTIPPQEDPNKNSLNLTPKIEFANNQPTESTLSNGYDKDKIITETQPKQESEQESPIIVKSEEPVSKDTDLNSYTSDYYNEIGLQYMNEGSYKQAYEYFQKAINTNPKNYEAINNLGLFYWQQGDKKLAEKTFHKAIRIDSSKSKALLNLGLLYKEMGKDKKYYNNIKKALSQNPNDYLSNWVMGNYLTETGRPYQAISYYQKSIRNNPDFYDAYMSLGNAYALNQEFENAYNIFQKALKINSIDPNLYYILGKNASMLDKDLEAKEYIISGLQLAQTDKLYLELAKISSKIGDYEESLAILMRHFSQTQEPEILNYIGLGYYKLKQPEIAIQYFKKLLAIDNSKSIYYYNLALCYKSLGDRDKFFQNIENATKILPKKPQDYIDLSYIYFDNGNKSYAITVLDEGISKFPMDKKLYFAKQNFYKTCDDIKNYNAMQKIIDEKFKDN